MVQDKNSSTGQYGSDRPEAEALTASALHKSIIGGIIIPILMGIILGIILLAYIDAISDYLYYILIFFISFFAATSGVNSILSVLVESKAKEEILKYRKFIKVLVIAIALIGGISIIKKPVHEGHSSQNPAQQQPSTPGTTPPAPAAQQTCDDLAADLDDSILGGDSARRAKQIKNASAAIDVCQHDLNSQHNTKEQEAALRYQLARALNLASRADEAEEQFHISADMGHPLAQTRYAESLFRNHEYGLSVSYFRKAEWNSPRAKFWLGDFNLVGLKSGDEIIVSQNKELGTQLMCESANLCDDLALSRVRASHISCAMSLERCRP